MAKRVDLIEGFVMDLDDAERNWTLKSNLRKEMNEEGVEIEKYEFHGHFGCRQHAIAELEEKLTNRQLKKHNSIGDLARAVEYAGERIDELITRISPKGAKL